jgi:hypothetical protein
MAYTFACLGVRQIAQSARLFSPAMNALGQSRRFGDARSSSALPLKTDIHHKARHVSKVPTRDSCTAPARATNAAGISRPRAIETSNVKPHLTLRAKKGIHQR